MSQQTPEHSKLDRGMAIGVMASFVLGFVLAIIGGTVGLVNGTLGEQAACATPATYIVDIGIGLLGLGFCGILYFQAKFNEEGSDNE